MKKLLATGLLSLAIAAPAVAGDSPLYAGPSLGSSTIGSSSSTSVGAFVGYKLDTVKLGSSGKLAVEAQYTSLGSVGNSDNFDSFGMDAVASLPINSMPNLSLYGKLGLNNITGNFRCNPTCNYTNSSGLKVDFGFGGQFNVTRDVGIRVGYQYFDSDFSTIYVAAVFNF